MWWLWCTAAALAGDPATEVRSALSMGDVRQTRKALANLDASVGSSREAVSPELLALRYQAEGAVGDLLSRQKERDEAFQAAWVVTPTGAANPDVLTRPDLVDAYNRVQSMVFQLPPVDLRWIELPDAPVLLDGVPLGQQPVFPGRHLVQVMCADGSWSSHWSSLNRSRNWGHACPDGALAPAGTVLAADGTPQLVVADVETPIDATPGNPSDATTSPPDGATPPDTTSPERPPPGDLVWYERGIQWVKDFELPRSPKGRLLMGGPVVGLGTGAELQFVPGGDSGGFFTTLAATHMPFHVGSEGVGVVRLSAGELGLGYQPSRKGAPGFEIKGGVGVYHDTLLLTDGYLYVNGAAGARWDAPGTGMFAFAGVAFMGNFARWHAAPRASVGWQF